MWLPPSWKIKNRDIATTVWPIATKCGMMTKFGTYDASQQLELCNFKNPTWRPLPFWKIEKPPNLGHSFSDFNKIWHSDVWSVTNLRSKEIQDGGGRHLNNLNITISRQRFDRSAQHMAWWRILALRSRHAIYESSYASFCAYILRTQILTCITLFTKLSYVQKVVNSCINTCTIWAVEWQKIFVKIASWWSWCWRVDDIPRCLVLESQQNFVYGDACKM